MNAVPIATAQSISSKRYNIPILKGAIFEFENQVQLG